MEEEGKAGGGGGVGCGERGRKAVVWWGGGGIGREEGLLVVRGCGPQAAGVVEGEEGEDVEGDGGCGGGPAVILSPLSPALLPPLLTEGIRWEGEGGEKER